MLRIRETFRFNLVSVAIVKSAGQCQMPTDPPQYGQRTLFLRVLIVIPIVRSVICALVLSSQLPRSNSGLPAPGGRPVRGSTNRSPLSPEYNFQAIIN